MRRVALFHVSIVWISLNEMIFAFDGCMEGISEADCKGDEGDDASLDAHGKLIAIYKVHNFHDMNALFWAFSLSFEHDLPISGKTACRWAPTLWSEVVCML